MPEGPQGQKRPGDMIAGASVVAKIATGKIPVEQGRPITEEDIRWLRQRRVRLAAPDRDPPNFVERMRDEDDERLLRRECGDADI